MDLSLQSKFVIIFYFIDRSFELFYTTILTSWEGVALAKQKRWGELKLWVCFVAVLSILE